MDTFGKLNLIGNSPAFKAAMTLIRKVSECDATVLIVGETGTGKELAARAIHYLGSRHNGPFVPVNCGTLPDALVESELFGHARGAFTDAKYNRRGLISEATGGTLFLDEVEAMHMHTQVALLRFLQEKEYRPIGGALIKEADVRVIAATNEDLSMLARRGLFRLDLLYRLNVLTIRMPALRERDQDAILLAEVFVERLNRQTQAPPRRLHPNSLPELLAYEWPGNVRELENSIQREYLMSSHEEIRVPLNSNRLAGSSATEEVSALADLNFKEAKALAIAKFEKTYIRALLNKATGNFSLAARISGKDRSDICRMAKKYGITRHSGAVTTRVSSS